MNALDRDQVAGRFEDGFDRLRSGWRRQSRGAQQPRSFTAKRADGGVQFTIIDRDPFTEGSGSTRYDVYWAETVDLSTAETVAAGFARATNVMSIPAPGKDGADATRILFGERYLKGHYFCVGVGVLATDRSEPTPPISLNDDTTSGGYPADVEHFAVSESGEVHNGVPYSVISFAYQAPNDPNFTGVKFFCKDYPVTGQIYQTYFHRYVGQRGGTGQGEFFFEVGRRKGVGTLSIAGSALTGVGSAFLSDMNAGDLIEVRGTTAEIDSVTDSTNATLAAAWGGDSVASVSDWWILPEVTFYAVSIGRDGGHREDIENAPSDVEFLDGLLSPPVPPVLVGNFDSNGVSTYGETNLLEFNQLEGTEIKAYHIYRATGAAAAFSSATHKKTIAHNPHAMTDGHHSWPDTEFTITEKEQNQAFTYYLVAENWREQRSIPSDAVQIACRLNSASSGDPSIPARTGVFNHLWNAGLVGTPGNTVDNADVSQRAWRSGSPAPPTGWTQWHSSVFSGAVTRPQHANGDQFRFFAPGLGLPECYAYMEINGWDNAAPVIRSGMPLTFQALIKHGGGVSPNGIFKMYIETYNAGAFVEYCPRRYRDPADDSLQLVDDTGGAANVLEIAGSDFLDSWQLFFATFVPTAANTVTAVRITFGWSGGDTGDIYVTQPMLSGGEELCVWTSEMVDTAIRPSVGGDPAGGLGDGPGGRPDLIFMP